MVYIRNVTGNFRSLSLANEKSFSMVLSSHISWRNPSRPISPLLLSSSCMSTTATALWTLKAEVAKKGLEHAAARSAEKTKALIAAGKKKAKVRE